MGCIARAIDSTPAVSVSYTHLDVYKRQAFQNLDLETIDKYTNDTSETTDTADDAISDLENEETGKAFVENLTFEILSSTEEGLSLIHI